VIYSCARILVSSRRLFPNVVVVKLRSRDLGVKSRCAVVPVSAARRLFGASNYLYVSLPVLFFSLSTFPSYSACLPSRSFSLTLSLNHPSMRLTSSYVLPILSFSALALAHANGPHHHRQVASAVSSAASSTATVASSTATAASSAVGSASGSTSLLPTPTGPIPTFSLVSTNPTAVPLTSIVVNAPSAPASATPTPYAVGSKPSDLPNAPGLPDSES
jgi:hypothetical protein